MMKNDDTICDCGYTEFARDCPGCRGDNDRLPVSIWPDSALERIVNGHTGVGGKSIQALAAEVRRLRAVNIELRDKLSWYEAWTSKVRYGDTERR